MATLTFEPFAPKDLAGTDTPIAVSTGRESLSPIAVEAAVLALIVVLAFGALITVVSGLADTLFSIMAIVGRMLLGLVAMIVVVVVFLMSRTGANSGPTPLPPTPAPTVSHVVAPAKPWPSTKPTAKIAPPSYRVAPRPR
jgi:hypothetical protein